MSDQKSRGALGRRYISRRSMLRGGAIGALGLAGAALVGCQTSSSSSSNTPSGGTAQATVALPGSTATAATAKVMPRGGQLIIGHSGEARGTDAAYGTGGGDHQFLYPLFDQLVAYDQSGLPNPSASFAEKWEQPDPLTIVFTLRQGVTMTDGAEKVDAELIKWNLERGRVTAATSSPDLSAIKSVDVVSANQVKVNLKEISSPLLTNLGDRGGFIHSRQEFDKVGFDGFKRAQKGSGPFRLTEWRQDALLKYERNKNYWRKDAAGQPMPYLDNMEFRIIPDNTVRAAALEAGEVDILIQTEAVDLKRMDGNSKLHSASFLGAGTVRYSINFGKRPPMTDERFRLAMDFASDRAPAIKNFYTGKEPIARGLLTPKSWAFSEDVPQRQYDPKKARDLLAATGIPEAQWVVPTAPTANGPTELEQYWKTVLAEVGIKVNFLPTGRNQAAVFFYKSFGGDESASMYATSWSMRVDPDGNFGAFYTEKSPSNPGYTPMPEVEALIVKGRTTLDPKERKVIYTQAENIARAKAYSIIPHFYTGPTVHAKKNVRLDNLFGGEGKQRWGELAIDK